MSNTTTYKRIMHLAARGTVALRNNGDDCVVMFDWPPSDSVREPIKVKGDSWDQALEQVDRLITTEEILADAEGQE